jgi:MinD-like ATPase involved in chromosome partitioning or flagellar assembly
MKGLAQESEDIGATKKTLWIAAGLIGRERIGCLAHVEQYTAGSPVVKWLYATQGRAQQLGKAHMPKIAKFIALHSFRAGTGRSSLIANFAPLLAMEGKRVAVVDTCLRTGNVSALLGFDEKAVPCSFHSYYAAQCALWQAAYEVTARTGEALSGRIYLVPANPTPEQIEVIRRDGYDPDQLADGFAELVERLALDFVLLDLDFGIDISTMSLIALADALLVLMRHDKRDYQGTSVIIELARQLDVPEIFLLMNEVPPSFDNADFEARVAELYSCPVAGVLPYTEEMATLQRGAIFVLQHPDHPNTHIMGAALKAIAAVTPAR